MDSTREAAARQVRGQTAFRTGLLTVTLLLGLPTGGQAARHFTGQPWRADFADAIALHDVVVEGQLITGISWPLPERVMLRVDECLIGTVTDSVLEMATPLWAFIATEQMGPGQRILAFGTRIPEQRVKLWGFVVPIESDGTLGILRDPSTRGISCTGPSWPDTLRGHSESESFSYPAVRLALGEARTQNAVACFDGKAAVALLRIRSLEPLAPRRLRLVCDSLGWVFGSLTTVPRVVNITLGAFCSFPAAAAGDTIVVPLHATDADSADLRCCPKSLLVEQGYVRAFGAAPTALPGIITHQATRLGLLGHVRRRE